LKEKEATSSNCGESLKLETYQVKVERHLMARVMTSGMVKTVQDVLTMGNPQPNSKPLKNKGMGAVHRLNGDGAFYNNKVLRYSRPLRETLVPEKRILIQNFGEKELYIYIFLD
jgi:hypothetical protein